MESQLVQLVILNEQVRHGLEHPTQVELIRYLVLSTPVSYTHLTLPTIYSV